MHLRKVWKVQRCTSDLSPRQCHKLFKESRADSTVTKEPPESRKSFIQTPLNLPRVRAARCFHITEISTKVLIYQPRIYSYFYTTLAPHPRVSLFIHQPRKAMLINSVIVLKNEKWIFSPDRIGGFRFEPPKYYFTFWERGDDDDATSFSLHSRKPRRRQHRHRFSVIRSTQKLLRQLRRCVRKKLSANFRYKSN